MWFAISLSLQHDGESPLVFRGFALLLLMAKSVLGLKLVDHVMLHSKLRCD